MNIKTVAANLRNTIAGKQEMLSSHTKYLQSAGTSGGENMAIYATVEFLKINIDELERILKDLEKCNTSSYISYDSDPYDGPMIKMFRED